MDISIFCSQCQRKLRIAESNIGKKVRCPGCSTIIDTAGLGTASPAHQQVPPESAGDEWEAPSSPSSKTAGGQAKAAKFQVKVINDPQRELKGVWEGTITPRALELSQAKKDVFLIPVRSKVESTTGSQFVVKLKGRDITLAVGQMNMYQERLARDLVTFLKGKGEPPNLSDYALPWYLLVLAFLPAGIGAFSLSAGALGGLVGGGLTGGLIGGNFAIIRREKWPLPLRVALSLAVSVVGYALLAWVVVTMMKINPAGQGQNPGAQPQPPAPASNTQPADSRQAAPGIGGGSGSNIPGSPSSAAAAPHELPGWGTFENPAEDCRAEVRDHLLTMEIPGTAHDLSFDRQNVKAPRILRTAPHDFVAEVKVIGDITPSEPPAPLSSVAFHGAGLLVWSDAENFLRLERASLVRGTQVQNYVLFQHHRNHFPQSIQEYSYPGGPLTLRLERRGSQMVASFSTDGVNQQSLTLNGFDSPDAKVGIAAVNTAAAPFRVEFQDLRVEALP